MIARFVAAAEANDSVDTEGSLDEMLASGSFESVVDDLLLPAAAALGDAWADGRLSVAGEHAASAAMGRRLSAAFQAAGVPRKVSVVVGLPPARATSSARLHSRPHSAGAAWAFSTWART